MNQPCFVPVDPRTCLGIQKATPSVHLFDAAKDVLQFYFIFIFLVEHVLVLRENVSYPRRPPFCQKYDPYGVVQTLTMRWRLWNSQPVTDRTHNKLGFC